MTTITCYDYDGNPHLVPTDYIQFRPAIYGILLDKDQVLLQRHQPTRNLQPPGRILQVHEQPAPALRRYFRSLVGFTPHVESTLIIDDQYIWDPAQEKAYHVVRTYYAVTRPAAVTMMPVDDTHDAYPEWVPLAGLSREQLQFGYEAIILGEERLTLQQKQQA
ncbi:MAG TPA: NUDIX domain-containing protein [Anaerolineae bacterium]|nr:NUDIX domain-containing protein [Anaerolineae bacterium]